MNALVSDAERLRQREEQLQTAEPGLDGALVEGATAREADDQLLRLDEGAANDDAVARAAAFEKQLADAREVRYQLALRSPSKVLVDNKYPTDVPDGFPVGPHPNWDRRRARRRPTRARPRAGRRSRRSRRLRRRSRRSRRLRRRLSRPDHTGRRVGRLFKF